jgi:TRAP-type C4-dicarboxylate transport system substrate-binding protein
MTINPLKDRRCLHYNTFLVSGQDTNHTHTIMTKESVMSYTAVINKETYRKNKTLFQSIILRKASSDLCNQLTKHKDQRLANFVKNKTISTTHVNRIARSIIV